jgi:hypothetical protein
MEDKHILFGSIILFIVILLIFSTFEDDKIIGDAVQYSNSCRGR